MTTRGPVTTDDPATLLAHEIRAVLTDDTHTDIEARVTAIVTRTQAAGLLHTPGPSHTEWGVLLDNGNPDGAFWARHRETVEDWVEDGDRLITRTRTTHPDTVTDWTYVPDFPADWTTEPD